MPGLAVEQLTLSHFRSHSLTRIAAEGRTVAITGPNGAGKTNILEAISMLSPGRGLRRAGPGELARRPEALGWRVRAELTSLGQVHDLMTGAEGEGTRSVDIDGKTAPQIALGRIARIVWLIPVMDRLWVEGASERRRFLDRLALSQMPDHGDLSLTYEKAMRERNRLLKDQIRDSAWYSALEQQMAEAGAALTLNRLETIAALEAAQGRRETAFPTARLALAAEGPTLTEADALAEALAEGRSRDMGAGRTLIGPHRADLDAVYAAKDVPARLCSTGEQKALLIALILANAAALAESFGAPPILLLDEVAAHLDPGRRAALYAEVAALGAQAWMTGTEPALFEDLPEDALRLTVAEDNGVSLVA
ncbi:MAG: DNA replication/repair protein RecF [Pseudomonadota bacterium]